MQAQVKEWGNSQGIRLSKEVLKSAGIKLNEFLDLRRRRRQVEYRRRQGQAPDRPVLVPLAEDPVVRQEHIQVGSVPAGGFVGGKGCGKHQPRR